MKMARKTPAEKPSSIQRGRDDIGGRVGYEGIHANPQPSWFDDEQVAGTPALETFLSLYFIAAFHDIAKQDIALDALLIAHNAEIVKRDARYRELVSWDGCSMEAQNRIDDRFAVDALLRLVRDNNRAPGRQGVVGRLTLLGGLFDGEAIPIQVEVRGRTRLGCLLEIARYVAIVFGCSMDQAITACLVEPGTIKRGYKGGVPDPRTVEAVEYILRKSKVERSPVAVAAKFPYLDWEEIRLGLIAELEDGRRRELDYGEDETVSPWERYRFCQTKRDCERRLTAAALSYLRGFLDLSKVRPCCTTKIDWQKDVSEDSIVDGLDAVGRGGFPRIAPIRDGTV